MRMTAEIIDALLWRTRAALRLDRTALFAGHGLADPLYRPPRLPYASVLGPLAYALEPERALASELVLTVRLPGYLGGAPLAVDSLVPGPGVLELLMDGDVRLTVPVDHGPDTDLPFSDRRARNVAGRIEAALRLAAADALLDEDPVDDDRRAELARATARWDQHRRRVVIASGRRGPTRTTSIQESSVRLAAPTAHAVALGLGDGAETPTGRLVRHRVPSPTAMSFDVRVDVWAGSQRRLADLVEAWARVTPTRCQLMLRPALLAADVPDGADEVHLQAGGEPATRWTALQLEPEGGFDDRRTGRAPELAAGAAVTPVALTLPGGATASLGFGDRPAVPDPTRPAGLAPTGWAVSVGLRAPGGADGDHLALVRVSKGATNALAVEVDWTQVAAANGQPARVEAAVTASARTAAGAEVPLATVRVPAVDLADAHVHALVDASAGQLAVFVDDVGSHGAPLGPVEPVGGDDMTLVLGGEGPDVEVTHLHLHTRPLGPLDRRQRSATAPASRWRPGDPVMLVRSSDGVTPQGTPFAAVVATVEDGVLRLDRPVASTWSRHDTVVTSRVVFSRQTAIRRRDDLASNLTRVSLEHTVSGFVEADDASVGAQLAESLDLQLADRARLLHGSGATTPARVGTGTPGVDAELVSAQSLRSTVVTADDATTAPPQPA